MRGDDLIDGVPDTWEGAVDAVVDAAAAHTDSIMYRAAAQAGVTLLEGAAVCGVLRDGPEAHGVSVVATSPWGHAALRVRRRYAGQVGQDFYTKRWFASVYATRQRREFDDPESAWSWLTARVDGAAGIPFPWGAKRPA